MKIAWIASAALAATLHLVFFLMESVLFGRPEVAARFGAEDPQVVAALQDVFLNQGFYNLFLAAGCIAGLALHRRHPVVGRTLVAYTCLCMLGAGVVLALSVPRLLGAAAVQALPPLLSLIAGKLAGRSRPAAPTTAA